MGRRKLVGYIRVGEFADCALLSPMVSDPASGLYFWRPRRHFYGSLDVGADVLDECRVVVIQSCNGPLVGLSILSKGV